VDDECDKSDKLVAVEKSRKIELLQDSRRFEPKKSLQLHHHFGLGISALRSVYLSPCTIFRSLLPIFYEIELGSGSFLSKPIVHRFFDCPSVCLSAAVIP
jgi:hypothetical protein